MLKRLQIAEFGSYEKRATFDFSPGVNIIVGKNGAGKSLLIEAIFWLVYARYLRASQQWFPHRNGTRIGAKFNDGAKDFSVIRAVSPSGKVSLQSSLTDLTGVREIKNYLNEVFGSFNISSVSTVFHRSTIGRFSLGGDAARRAVIEEIIGVADIDRVARELLSELGALSADLSEIKSELSSCELSLSRLRGAFSEVGVVIDITDDRAKLDALLEKLRALKALKEPPVDSSEVNMARNALATARAVLRQRESELKRFIEIAEAGVCPLCGAECSKDIDGAIQAREALIEESKTEVKEKEEVYHLAVSAYEVARNKFDKKVSRWNESVSNLRFSIDKLTEEIFRNERRRERKEVISRQISDNERELSLLSFSADSRQRDINRVNDLLWIYGPKGARLRLVASALDSLSSASTDVLQAIRGTGRVVVEADASLERIAIKADLGRGLVHHGGLSEGERSIVDFSLLKALGSIPGNYSGIFPIIYDDVFDSLDEQIKEGVAQFVAEESAESQVFVLTHDAGVVDYFPDGNVIKL